MLQYGVIGCVLCVCAHTACAPSSDVDRMQDFLGHMKGDVAPRFEAQSKEIYWDMKDILPDRGQLFVHPDISQSAFNDPKDDAHHRNFAIQQVKDRAPMFVELTDKAVHFIQRQKPFIDASIDALKARRRYVFYKNMLIQYEKIRKDVESLASVNTLMARAQEVTGRAERLIGALRGDSVEIQSDDRSDIPQLSSPLLRLEASLSDLLTPKDVFFEDSPSLHVPPTTPEEGQVESSLTGQSSIDSKERDRLVREFLSCHHRNLEVVARCNEVANAQDKMVRGYMTYVEDHCPRCEVAPLYYQDWLAQQ
jgi:hypothetical protein